MMGFQTKELTVLGRVISGVYIILCFVFTLPKKQPRRRLLTPLKTPQRQMRGVVKLLTSKVF